MRPIGWKRSHGLSAWRSCLARRAGACVSLRARRATAAAALRPKGPSAVSTCPMQRPSRCIWPLSPAWGQDEPVGVASIADRGAPAAPLAATTDHLSIGVAPAAAPCPRALPRSRITAGAVVGGVVGVAGSVIGPGTSVGTGNAEPQQGADGHTGGHAAVPAGFSGTGWHRAETQDQCRRQSCARNLVPHGDRFPLSEGPTLTSRLSV